MGSGSMRCAHCGALNPGEKGPCPHCDPTRASPTPTKADDPSTRTSALLERAPTQSLRFEPGQAFGERYTIVEEVGSGGMGQVHKAIDRQLGKTVALKLIRPEIAAESAALQRFRRELALAQQVSHANVCRVHDLGEVEGTVYISMEYVEGQTLSDLIQSMGHLSPRQTVALGRQICAALRAIHERGIVHRDLKPANIMVDRSGHAIVMDFGLAYHHAHDHITKAGAVMGTLAYLSPEQARGKATDQRSDIYSLGLVLFEMLTGRRPPGDGGSVPLALRDPQDACPGPGRIMADIPDSLDALVLRCLERDPARRFPSADELDRSLAHASTALSSGVSSRLRVLAGQPGRPWPFVASAAAFLLLVIGGVLLYQIRPSPAPEAPRSLALMPLTYDGPVEKAYLKDAIPAMLAGGLRASPGLRVAPFPSSRTFRDEEDLREVGQQLGVGSVVQGQLKILGQKYQASFHASSIPDGKQTWSRTVEGDAETLISRTTELAGEIASAFGEPPLPAGAGGSRNTQALEHYLRGRVLLEGWDIEKSYVRAEEAFRKAIALDAQFAEAHAMLALALWTHYRATQDTTLVQPAVDAAVRATSLAPSLPETQLALGVVELGRGRSAEAADAFRKALKLAPADDAVCRLIADTYFALDRHDDAERMYQKAIELRPGYWESYNYKGAFHLQRGELEKAKALFRKVIELRPATQLGYSNLASTHIWAGEMKEAEPLLETALKIQPTAAVRNNLGLVYYATDRFEDAAREFRAAIELGQNAARWGNLGDAYRQMGRGTDARDAYARAIELGEARLRVNATDAQARAALSLHLAGAGRCGDARSEVERTVAEADTIPIIHFYAAVAHAVCGDREAASRDAARAVAGGVVAEIRTNPDLRKVVGETRLRKLLGD
jgi:tetratricopeptide (TPR) repeat protein/tRNA A-37 threonylcarbamoyl transferase component Bud32/TolB-like protein